MLVVDDSPAVRTLLAARLRALGHDVEEAPDATVAMERALAKVPDLVVTDLTMAGLSGVQLCRLLRSEPMTSHVPVVLLTGSDDKRSRFWAHSAGATAYVAKDRIDDVVALLANIASVRPPAPVTSMARAAPRRPINERISSILDAALFDSVVAGEVRALASSRNLTGLFEGLIGLLVDVLSYRWFALRTEPSSALLLVHGHPSEREVCERAARTALGAATAGIPLSFVGDERATAGEGGPVHTGSILFAGAGVGQIALAPTARGMSREDRSIVALVEGELGGPLQMTSLYEDARRMATTDALTGLLNRRAFIETIDRERARSDRHSFPLSLLLLDVDHFKRINDQYGHAAGDVVLQGVARVLEAVARRSDYVARWGGEEFVVGLPQTGEAGARVAGERVRRAIAAATHKLPDVESLQITASVGIASGEAPWSLDALVAAADEAMYAAKARGRNRVELAPRAAPPTGEPDIHGR